MKQLKTLLKTKQEIPLKRAVILETFFTSSHFRERINIELKAFDLSIEQFNVLRILRGQNGKPLNLQDIQERMVTRMSNTSRLIDKLILKGLVIRSQCKNNRGKIDIVEVDKCFYQSKNTKCLLQYLDHRLLLAPNMKHPPLLFL